MDKSTHGKNGETFEELTFAQQAQSFNGYMLAIESVVNAHVKRAEHEKGHSSEETREKCKNQLFRLVERLFPESELK
jgi:hypothetical protein